MLGRRISYVLLLVLSIVFAIAYGQWLAWFLLAAVAALPLFSLLVGLPAMVGVRIHLRLPHALTVGQEAEPLTVRRSLLPTPPWQCVLRVDNPLTCQRFRLREDDLLPTDHCGILNISTKKAKIYDYSGLFSFPVRLQPRQGQITVRPESVPIPDLPSTDPLLHLAWRPKLGGGFAENHELRLYRPGDSVQQIHWKLSAKTGKLILRQPMEPVRGRVLVRMDLMGTPSGLDRKLGQLLWLGRLLLEKDVHFQIQCLTGNGVEHWAVINEKTLTQAMDAILSCPPAVSGTLIGRPELADWQYFIGGDGHEA